MKNRPFRPTRLLVVAACCAAVLGGCSKRSGEATAAGGQVVAHVGNQVVTNQELENELRLANIPTDKQKDPAIVRQVLGQLVVRKYFLQQALAAKLDREPGVLLDLLRAREQVLENAYLVRTVDAKSPTKAEIDRYIADNPAKFANRKLFQVEQIVFPINPSTESLIEASRDAKTLDEVDQRLTSASVPHARQNGVLQSGELNRELVEKIEGRKNDDIFFVRSGQKGVFFKVVGEEARPVQGEAAVNLARQFMRSDAIKGELGIASYTASREATYEGDYQQIMQGERKSQ